MSSKHYSNSTFESLENCSDLYSNFSRLRLQIGASRLRRRRQNRRLAPHTPRHWQPGPTLLHRWPRLRPRELSGEAEPPRPPRRRQTSPSGKSLLEPPRSTSTRTHVGHAAVTRPTVRNSWPSPAAPRPRCWPG